MARKRILIVGLGNILLGDEGVGVRVAEQLSFRSLPEEVEVIDVGTACCDLLTFLEGREKVIIIDAIKADDEPGSVYLMNSTILEEDSYVHLSLHQIGLKNVLKMASLVGMKPEITLVGIVPKEYHRFKIGLSREVEEAIPLAMETVIQEMESGLRKLISLT